MGLLQIGTRDFGELEIAPQDIITFEGAIFGFEEYREFVFLFQEDVSEHFVWLQSTQEPDLCFILVDPALVAADYRPDIPQDAARLLGPGEYMCWVTTVIKERFEDSTVNLRSPIVVNPATRKAAQVILEEEYPLQHPLLSRKEGA